MIIRIKSCQRKNIYWYAGLIGTVFEVISEKKEDGFYVNHRCR